MLLVGWALIMVCGHICLNYLILAPQEVQEGRPLDPSLPASGWVSNLGALMVFLGHAPSQAGTPRADRHCSTKHIGRNRIVSSEVLSRSCRPTKGF